MLRAPYGDFGVFFSCRVHIAKSKSFLVVSTRELDIAWDAHENSDSNCYSSFFLNRSNSHTAVKYVPIVHYARTSTLLRISNRHIGDHFPVQYGPRDGPDGYDNRRKCRICQKKSNIKCSNTSCNVALCINDCGVNLNCWGQFHKKK